MLIWVWVYWCFTSLATIVSHICDDTDVQAGWRRSCTYGRAPNAIDISQGSLTCPSYTDTGPPFLYCSDTPPNLVAFYEKLGIRRTYKIYILDLNPRRPHGGICAYLVKLSCQNKIRSVGLTESIKGLFWSWIGAVWVLYTLLFVWKPDTAIIALSRYRVIDLCTTR